MNPERKINDKIQCLLCPHLCKLAEGKTGICGVRKNTGGKIELLTYGVISGFSLDPVEKKPLYHFFPGKSILSVGSYGCNMRCDFCQNYHISQNISKSFSRSTTPDHILHKALGSKNNIGIAFTYNEPVIWFEFIKDTAELIKEAGLYTVMVTNGYVTGEFLAEYLRIIDAFNVDLKSFNNDFYRKIAGAELEPVKNTLKQIAKAGRHLEITSLVITGLNDKIYEMEAQVKWIADELGKDTPFHLSRYFPMYKRDNPVTPQSTLQEFYETASRHLTYVYLGNTMSDIGQDTICPECNSTITKRSGYYVQNEGTRDGTCSVCGLPVYKYFTSAS